METFKEVFCRYYNCRPEEYIRKALSESLYPRAQWLAPLLRWLGARTIKASLTFLRDVGECRNREEIRDAIREFHYYLEHQGTFLAQTLKIRVSTREVMKLHYLIRRKQRYAVREASTSPAMVS